ncbi:putative F-box domain-containing protein [Lupinus albus]|uniref:Putative F-box domain-containing protein n=1 Tax=Lupinus albus TaxID=3870 RepID=A0A6A4NL95_LUPAL|nr:putative F-box domain-containing protein [Lupinus albus]
MQLGFFEMVGNGNCNGNMAYDIMINILKRLPVKSLFRFKCVSKDWFNLFNSPYFISLHLQHSTLLLLFQRIPLSNLNHSQSSSSSSSCLIGQDFKVHNPQFIDFAVTDKVIGSCNGLLCVKHTNNNHMLSISNPATREIRQVPEILHDIKSFYYFGFGFSPIANDYKVVRISVPDEDRILDLDDIRVSRAEVYSLTSGAWREIDATILQTLYLMSNSVTVNGVMFWQAFATDPDAEFVVSFDISSEMFTLFESSSIELWVLEAERWVKQYSVGPFSRILYPLSIWGDEIVCREELHGRVDEYSKVETVLSLFNPYSNELKKLPAQRDKYYYVSFNYAESVVPVANVHHEQE